MDLASSLTHPADSLAELVTVAARLGLRPARKALTVKIREPAGPPVEAYVVMALAPPPIQIPQAINPTRLSSRLHSDDFEVCKMEQRTQT
jgi:hypothetical protein